MGERKPDRQSSKPESAREQILRFLDTHGVVNKDRGRTTSGTKRLTGRNAPPFTIDLHGYTQDRAAHLVRSTITRCRSRGIRKVLIVHGRGFHSDPHEGPVLKTMIRGMLDGELAAVVIDWKPGRPKEGGDGATVVRLR